MPEQQNELELAKAIRDEELPSPQRVGSVTLFAMRISGTGHAYRGKLDELVYRDPKIFLSDDFLERVQGLPVIIEHPESRVLDTNEFRRRVVGSIMLPYVRRGKAGDELWGIARIMDADAAGAMETLELSTSPSVILRAGESERIELNNGKHLLIESDPLLVDHVAIVSGSGVWDKAGEAGPGIEVTERNDDMNDKTEIPKEPEGNLDKLLSKLDDCIAKMDGLSSRMDVLETKRRDDDAARENRHKGRLADDDGGFAEQPNMEEHRELGEARRLVADDGELRNALADAQARADDCAAQWGARAPAPLVGESLARYRRRLVRPFQKHSELYRDVDFAGWPDIAFDEAEKRIYADSAVAATSADGVPEGMLRAVTREMPNGAKMTKFIGHPSAWMNQFMPARRFCTRLSPQGLRSD